MYGSVLIVLSTLELFGNTTNPEGAKGGPDLRPMQPETSDISGYYTCKGQEAGGKTYSGVVVLTKKSDVYLISWVVGGGSTFSGIAIRQGNSLAASWTMTTERGLVRGINLYRIEADKGGGPSLVGRWASVPGPGLQLQEKLTFLKKLEVEE